MALGNFDGVHKGHQKIIKEATAGDNLSSVIYTFHPHPREVFSNKEIFKLTNFRQKYEIIKQLGADYLICENFNEKFRALDAESFFYRVLIGNLDARHIVIGDDFIFGKGRSGNAEFLKEHCAKNGIKFTQIKQIESDKQIISSSRIRSCLREGNIKQANQLLGREYEIEGKIVQGRKLARQLGYPTANIILPQSNEIKRGVYKATYNGKNAIINIGIKPTVTEDNKLICEAHILNFNEDLYGKRITLKLTNFIREEQKFNSIEELKAQIKKDVETI